MYLRTSIFSLILLVAFSRSGCGQETGEQPSSAIEFASPDGKFAFRSGPKTETADQTYVLIETSSGKVLATVAKSDDELGSSARFGMAVLWRPDSKAFALMATLIKLGSELSVWTRDGDTFHPVKLPKFVAEIPEKEKRGKKFAHISALSSQSAKQWRKDDSLVVEILTMQDGNDGSLSAIRTLVLGFTPDRPAKVLKSTVRYVRETP